MNGKRQVNVKLGPGHKFTFAVCRKRYSRNREFKLHVYGKRQIQVENFSK